MVQRRGTWVGVEAGARLGGGAEGDLVAYAVATPS